MVGGVAYVSIRSWKDSEHSTIRTYTLLTNPWGFPLLDRSLEMFGLIQSMQVLVS